MTDNANTPKTVPTTQTAEIPSSKDTPVQESATTSSPSTTNGKPKIHTKPNTKGKSRRARPRRRGADSDSHSHHSALDNDSLTEPSDSDESDNDDEDDEEAVEDAVSPKDEKSSEPPVFVDVSSVTPAGWDNVAATEEVSFDDFNKGKTGTTRGRGRGRGGVVGVQEGDRPKKVYTEAETKKYEEAKARRKEKVKAKKGELREAKKKRQETETGTAAAEGPSTTKDALAVEGISSTPAAAASKPTNTKSTSKPPLPVNQTSTTKPGPAADGPKGKGKPKPKKGREAPATSTVPSNAQPSASTPSSEPVPPATSVEQPEASTSAQPSSEPPQAPDASNLSPHGSRFNTREAYAQRVANDPKFTPRVGNFWTHDQRHYESGQVGEGGYTGLRQMSDYWRGRGGPMRGFRGGFRGRGGPGLFVPPAYRPRQELTGRPIGGSKLAMDREVEMEEAKKASASALASASVPPVEPEATEDQPVFGGSPARGGPKWGHEAFESIRAVDTFQANRSVRGRGRGAFAGRGGFPLPHASAPHHVTDLAALPTSDTAADSTHVPPPPPAIPIQIAPIDKPASLAEANSTQPDIDSLIDDMVKVRLPGATESTEIPRPAPPPKALPQSPVVVKEATVNGTTPAFPVVPQPSEAGLPPQVAAVSSNTSSPAPPHLANGFIPNGVPAPLQYASITGSDGGSISSAGQYVSAVAPAPPPGVGITPNGEYFDLATGTPIQHHSRALYQRSYPPPQQFYPQQSYSPDPFMQQRNSFSAAPMQSPQGYYPNGAPDGRGSPFNPYNQQPSGFYQPSRPSKAVPIRAPSTSKSPTPGGNDEGNVAYASVSPHQSQQLPPQGYYTQHYNPYAGPGQMGFSVQAQPGQGQQGQEGMYYSNGGVQYGYGGEVAAGYGYEGGYPGY